MRAYFIGIGGIGMSALARFLKAQKWDIEGSDAQKSTITAALEKEGIKVKIGQKKPLSKATLAAIRRNSGMVIYNRAIPHNNPEFASARRAGLCLISYAEALGSITKAYETIAITGSHGKSTTTALTAVMMLRAKLDPSVLIGTKLANLGGTNMRLGKGPYLVLEADDYQAAFLNYSPSIVVVTNIDREHMDFYKTFARVKRAFFEFLIRTRPGGTLILNKDDAPLFSLHTRIAKLAAARNLTVVWYSQGDRVRAKKVKSSLTLPGAHNLSNGLAVYALGRALSIPEAAILSGLREYRGAWRRMEYRGTFTEGRVKVKVFDDYAHHPSEIRATLAGFREQFPRTPLFVVFQPHQAKRLAVLFKDFITAFHDADALWIAPIYAVAGRDEAPTNHNAAALVRAISRHGNPRAASFLKNPRHVRSALATTLTAPAFQNTKTAVLVMMGAGSIVDYTDSLLARH